jgi:hypothetical protein
VHHTRRHERQVDDRHLTILGSVSANRSDKPLVQRCWRLGRNY